MDIKISMKDSTNSPEIKIFHGNFALEEMFKQVSEKYFGKDVAKEIQNILSKKITIDEINKVLNTPIHEKDINKVLNTDVNKFIREKRSNK